jgi:hypothetical protein
MYRTSQSLTQVVTIFGPGYVPEQRGEETHCHLPWGEKRDPIVNFDELLKKLRAALSLH